MKMGKLQIAVLAASLVGILNTQAGILLNFDDLPDSTAAGSAMPATYQGFIFQGGWKYLSDDYSSVAAPSGHNFVYSDSGAPVAISRLDGYRFDFEGADFAAWAGNPSASVTIEGWRGGALVGQVSGALSPAGFTSLSSDLKNVDKVVFKNDGTPQNGWLMDNFADAVIIPEPMTMLAAALLVLPFGVSTLRRIRKNRAA